MGREQKALRLNIEEIRPRGSSGYGSNQDVIVRITHPLLKGCLERTVKRRQLDELYRRLEGTHGKRRNSRYANSMNAGILELMDTLVDGAHMDMGSDMRGVADDFHLTTPESKDELGKALGENYLNNRDLRIGVKR